MGEPVLVELKGIGSVDPGTGPGGISPIPLPASLPLLMAGLSLLGTLKLRHKRRSSESRRRLALS